MLEKGGITGGSTNVSEGALNAVDPERQGKQGIEDSIEVFYDTTTVALAFTVTSSVPS